MYLVMDFGQERVQIKIAVVVIAHRKELKSKVIIDKYLTRTFSVGAFSRFTMGSVTQSSF